MQLANRGYFIGFGILASAIYFIAWQVLTSSAYRQNPDLVLAAITFDMTITVSLLYYFMVIRKRGASAIQLIPVLIAATFLASLILPNDKEQYLNWIKYSLMFTEFFVITYLTIKVRDIMYSFKQQTDTFDITEKLKIAIMNVLNNKLAANIMSSELSMIYYAATFKRPLPEIEPSAKHFTCHKQSGYSTMFWVIIFLVIVEGIGIHLIVSRWSPIAAMILSVLNLYGFIFIIADYSAIKKKPVQVTSDQLLYRMGLRWNVAIPLDNISKLEINPLEKEEKDEDLLDCSTFGSPDIVIHLNNEMTASGIYGIKKRFSKLAFNIDDKQEFASLLNEHLEPEKTPVYNGLQKIGATDPKAF